jgi:hypothetical protein
LILVGHWKRQDAEVIVAHVDVVASRNFNLKRCMSVKHIYGLFVDLTVETEDLKIAGLAIRSQGPRLGKASRNNLIGEQKGVDSAA